MPNAPKNKILRFFPEKGDLKVIIQLEVFFWIKNVIFVTRKVKNKDWKET